MSLQVTLLHRHCTSNTSGSSFKNPKIIVYKKQIYTQAYFCEGLEILYVLERHVMQLYTPLRQLAGSSETTLLFGGIFHMMCFGWPCSREIPSIYLLKHIFLYLCLLHRARTSASVSTSDKNKDQTTTRGI